MRERLQALRDDNRGAIMVIAAFMAVFLVGALWYVAGVGNAALFRERMQDGADAAAFTAAVVHARGMNIIAMLNLIMAAILAVLVALKIAKMLLTITKIITTIICALPYGVGLWACPIKVAAGIGENAVEELIQTVEPMVNNLLKVLSKLEVTVAKVMPVIALEKTNSTAKLYEKPVEGALMVSDSLLADGKLGLPVEEDSYKELCKRAGEFVAEFALAPFSVFGVPTSWAKGLVGGLVSMAPSYFCGDDGGGSSGSSGSGSSGGAKPSNYKAAAKQICDSQQQAIDEANKKNGKKKKISNDYDKCIEDETKNQKALEEKSMSGAEGGGGKTPKKVVEGAKNGNQFFQINVFAWGDMKLTKMSQRKVSQVAWGKLVVKPPPYWGKIQMSNAEYYYDGSGDWDKLKEDALWNMRWRARLRRYHQEISPASSLMKAASLLSLPAGFMDAIGLYNGGGLGGLQGSFLGDDGKERLSDIYTKNAKKTVGGQGYEKIDRNVKMEFVH
jgi:hypothetical protein